MEQNLLSPWAVTPLLDRLRRRRVPLREYGEVLAVIAAVTVLGRLAPISYRALGHVYLLAVVVLCLRVGRWPILAAAVVSALAWNFVIIPPRLSLSVLDSEDGLLLGTYFVVALIAGQLLVKREEWRAAAERAKLLAESERLHRALMDSVSHELKTPLAVLRSAAEALEAGPPERRRDLQREIRTAVERLDRLVANLLSQNRLEAGAIRPQLDWHDARDLIGAARREAEGALAGRTCQVEVPPQMPLLRADGALMEQAIGNLLLNAARHTPPGSPLRIMAGTAPREKRAFIAVADRGGGIPPELRGALFRKFSRGPEAGAGGLGLGLAIVRGFMQAQGGEVSVGENPGGGACFTLHLPLEGHESVPNE